MENALVLLIALQLGATPATASQPGRKTFTTPELQGIVLEMQAPRDWKITFVSRFAFELSAPVADARTPYLRVGISASRMAEKALAKHGWKPDGSAKPEDVLASYVKKPPTYFQDERRFQRSEGLLAGHKAICDALGPASYFDENKQKVPTPGPVLKVYHAMTGDYTYLCARVRCRGPQPEIQTAFGKMAPLGESIVASIRQLDLSAMTTTQKSRVVPRLYDSPFVTISRRRDYYVKMQAALLCPPGWQVKETTNRPAGGTSEKGLYAIDVVPPIKVKNDQFAPRITIVMEGLAVGPLSKSDFLKTLDRHVKGILPDHKLLSTKEMRFGGMSVLAMSRSRYTEPTRSTVVRTFSGQDPYGRTLKVRAYTAGGMTMACHIILVADAANYEQILPEVDEVLDLARIHLQSPSLGYPN